MHRNAKLYSIILLILSLPNNYGYSAVNDAVELQNTCIYLFKYLTGSSNSGSYSSATREKCHFLNYFLTCSYCVFTCTAGEISYKFLKTFRGFFVCHAVYVKSLSSCTEEFSNSIIVLLPVSVTKL